MNLFKKKIKSMLDNFIISTIVAGVFLLLSFYIINEATRRSSVRSQKELVDSLQTSTKTTIANINETTKTTLGEINSATDTMVEESKKASKKITKTIDDANQQLDKQLELIESATKNLKNQMENQEILLEIKYSFDWTKADYVKQYPENYTFSMVEQLSKNNYYQIKIKSKDGKESYFATDINSFQTIDNIYNEMEMIDNLFAPVVIINEHTQYSHSFNMKFPIKAVNINFLLDQISTGYYIEFILTKNTAVKQSYDNTIPGGFALFAFGTPGESVGEIELGIKLRNGKTFKSKTTSCTITGTNSWSFRCYAEIQ